MSRWLRGTHGSSAAVGFWPGGGKEGVFYSYAYPEPGGFSAHRVEPDAAYYSHELKEFLLPYEAVHRR
jgi:hypothetical protein